MRSPSPRCRPSMVRLYRYRPGQDPDAGAVADESSLIAADVDASVQVVGVATEAAGKRLRQTFEYDVFLYAQYGLKLKDLITWVDSAGTAHGLFVAGPLDQVGVAAVWRVKAREVI